MTHEADVKRVQAEAMLEAPRAPIGVTTGFLLAGVVVLWMAIVWYAVIEASVPYQAPVPTVAVQQ